MDTVHGGDIYTNNVEFDFSANINPLGVNKHIKKAVIDSLTHMGEYPDIKATVLRKQLADKLGTNQDFLYFGNGAADVLFTLVLATKPRKALLVTPTFSEYEQALKSVDCEVIKYALISENGFSVTQQYLNELNNEIDMIILCNPNNPVGNTIPKALLIDILKRCREYNILMVMDECFCDFLDNHNAHSLLEQVKTYNNLVIVKAFTKMYAMAGLRLGYLVSSNENVLKQMYKVSQPWSVSIPAQAAGIAAVKEVAYVDEAIRYVKKEREFLCNALKQFHIPFFIPEANYILFYDTFDWYSYLLEKRILIRDCSNYEGLTKGYYRIAVRTRHENEQLVNTMKELIEQNK